jgi:hypothetical protein
MNLSPRLLAYKPRSDYFKQRWGDALAWVEEQKKHGGLRDCGGTGDGFGRGKVLADVEGQAQVVQMRGETHGFTVKMQRLCGPESSETTGGILQKAARKDG